MTAPTPAAQFAAPGVTARVTPGATDAALAAVIAWLEKQRGVGNG